MVPTLTGVAAAARSHPHRRHHQERPKLGLIVGTQAVWAISCARRIHVQGEPVGSVHENQPLRGADAQFQGDRRTCVRCGSGMGTIDFSRKRVFNPE